jgi:branched-subunit amino acid aminotransferase/4-amino-4-deoxychorismate lyase
MDLHLLPPNQSPPRPARGVYSTLRTYRRGRAVLPLAAQLARLHESAALLGAPLTLDAAAVRAALRQAAAAVAPSDARLRLTLDLDAPALYVSVEAFPPLPAHVYRRGVWVVSFPAARHNPRAKATDFQAQQAALRAALPAGAHEGLLVADGLILEGLSSNFFAIRGDTLWTAEAGVLAGVTRAQTLAAAAAIGLAVRLEPVPLAEIDQLEGAGLTSASRGVLPIRRIDGVRLPPITPTSWIRRLRRAFAAQIAAALEPL